MMKVLPLAILLALTLAGPAHAGGLVVGLVTWIGGIGTTIAGSAAWTWLTTNVWGRLVASLAISALQARLQRRKVSTPGIRSKQQGTGGLNPRAFGFGIYATAGTKMAPDNSYGGGNNYWLTQVLDLSDIKGAVWKRMAVDGEWVAIDPASPIGHWAGQTLLGKFAGKIHVRLRTGLEATADAALLANYGTDPARPWTADMKGNGITQAILHFGYEPTLFNGIPATRHEVQGIPVFDPRGKFPALGTQVWSNPATWAFRENPMVHLYNLMRGVTLEDIGVWGGKIAEADLPEANWIAAMNVCDVPYARATGGPEPRFRAGMEVKVTDQPHEVAAALLDAASAEIADCGGTWKVRAGEPGLPVYFFTDADTLINLPEDLDPFPESEKVVNAIRAVYTSPEHLYEAIEGPLVTNPVWEALDGEQRIVELPLTAVTSPTQAQRIVTAELNAQRRWRTHRVPLPPDAMVLEPLDVVSWTSLRNGYVGKLFEVTEIEDHAETMTIIAALREVDPSDYSWSSANDPNPPSANNPKPPVAPFSLTAVTLTAALASDGGGTARRRVLTIGWPSADLAGMGLEYEVRRQGETALLCSGAVLDAAAGTATVPAEPLAGATYEARVRLSSITPQTWSGWIATAVPARRNVGSPALTALGSAMAVTNATTTFTPVAGVAVADAAFTGQEAGFAKLQCSLTGAATARLVWRQIARQTPSGGSYIIFERIEELTSGRTLILSGGGSVAAPWTTFSVTTEVSGELLPAGATVTITHHANQFITPHA
jgi:hypothetical protein